MPKLVFKSLRKIKNVGRFVDWSSDQELPKLRRFNLFYGFNGSGKTSIARILGDLGLPPGERKRLGTGRVTIDLDDESTVDEASDAQALRGRIFVFSIDFVRDNFKWNESTANPVFYLGEEQAELAEKLVALKDELAERSTEHVAALIAFGTADNTFQSFKRDKARQIGQALGIARQYNAASLAGDITGTYSVKDKLSDDERSAHQKLLLSTEEYQQIQLELPKSVSVDSELKEVSKILAHVPDSEALKSLHPHEQMAGWVQTGAQYHVDNELDHCLHCYEPITAQVKSRLAALVEDETKVLLRQIDDNKNALAKANIALTGLLTGLPDPSLVVPLNREDVRACAQTIRATVQAMTSRLGTAAKALDAKVIQLGTAIAAPVNIDPNAASNDAKTVFAQFERLAELAAAHNAAAGEIHTTKQQAHTRLKREMLFDAVTVYQDHCSEFEEKKAEVSKASDTLKILSQQIFETQDLMKSHQQAAKHISNTVTRFLGHGELTVKPTDEGYSICRDNELVSGPLSEGERTAIAFCYFLVLLTAEGRKLEDLIVIVDDPISSLDSGALNYTASLVSAHLQKCGQGIVLTHNINFFHEIKKWLKRMEAGRDPDGIVKWKRAGLFYVSSKKDFSLGHRISSIEKLSKLLREYESEYHFLFFLIGTAAKDRSVSDEQSVLLPNAIRKALDTFLAFRHPSSSPIEEKAADLVKDTGSFDKIRLASLLRLVQTESHGDSIADSTSFCPMTTEEANEACQNFMYYVSIVDPEHFRRMKDICDLGDAQALCGLAAATLEPAA